MAHSNSILVQQPAQASQLVLVFHGVGANAQGMLPLAQAVARAFPLALVVAVNSPDPSFAPGGYEWFSVMGITEENRQARVDQAMPAFLQCIAHWQAQAGVGPEATALLGFSQGAIMALESTKLDTAPASRVVSFSGRFANLPANGGYNGTVHFLHGKEDPVISYQHTIMAAHHLHELGVDMTAEVRPFVQHALPPEFIALAITKLSTHISHRVWQEVLENAQKTPPAAQ